MARKFYNEKDEVKSGCLQILIALLTLFFPIYQFACMFAVGIVCAAGLIKLIIRLF